MSPFQGFVPPSASFTPVPNQFFDEVVGHHPACVVAVVAILIRATLGWENRHTRERRVEAELPLPAFVRPELSRTSARAGLAQAIEAGLVIRTGEPTNRSGGRYALRWRDAAAQQDALARERRAGAVQVPPSRPSDDCSSEDGLAEDGLAEDGLAEDGLAEDGLAEDGLAGGGGEGPGGPGLPRRTRPAERSGTEGLGIGRTETGQTGTGQTGTGQTEVGWTAFGRAESGPPESGPPLIKRSKKERDSESTFNVPAGFFQQGDQQEGSAPDRQARTLQRGQGGAGPRERRGDPASADAPAEGCGADAAACGEVAGAWKRHSGRKTVSRSVAGRPDVPRLDAPVEQSPAAARRGRIVENLVAELSDRGSERRHHQLIEACDRKGLYGLPEEALRATRRRLGQEGRLGVLERPGAYYQRILLCLMEDHQVFVPAGRPGEREEVRRLARLSLGMAGGGPLGADAPPEPGRMARLS